MTDTYKVIQADREMAAEYFRNAAPYANTALERARIAQGELDDNPLIQMLAKHREDTEALIVGWLREVLTMDRCCSATLKQCADAIVRGDHHTNNTPGD